MSDWLSKLSIVTPLNKPLENGAEYYFKADLPDGAVSLWSKDKVFLGELKDGKIQFTAGTADDEVIVSSNVATSQADLLLCLQQSDFRCVPAPEDLTYAKQYQLAEPLKLNTDYTLSVEGQLDEWTGVWLSDSHFAGYLTDGKLTFQCPADLDPEHIIIKSLTDTATIDRVMLSQSTTRQDWLPAPEDVQALLDKKADTESLGDLAYDDLVELAKLGSTIISGGYVKTELLDATAINSQVVHISASTSFALGYDPSSKRRVFNSQPTPPYDVGDLWTGGSTGDLRRCKTARADGSYSAADWELASKYTDDTTVNALAGNLKDMAYEDIVELSMLGETIIVGGYLKTELLDATAINTQIIQIGSGTSFATGYDPSAKNRIFSSTPTTPYYVGDLWTQGSTGDIRRCKTARTSGSYQAADWEIASKYTDDTAVNSLSGSLKDMAFENTVELAKLGTTIIQGGYIKTDLIYIGSGSSYAVGYDPSKIPYVGANLLLESGVPVTSNQYLIKSYTPVTPLIEGKQYIITVTLTPAAGVTGLAPTASNGYYGLPNLATSGTSKQTISQTFIMGYSAGRKPSDHISNANIGIYRIPNDGSVTGNTTIHRIKIEEGNKATAWEAAAEDSVQQNVSYKGVMINENDGFVSAATIGGKTTLVKMNAIDGIGITHDGDKTFGVDTDGSTYVTKLKNPNDPTAYASIGRTAAAGGSIFTLYGTSGYGNPRRKLSIESYLRTAVHMEVPMPEQTGDGDYNGANMFALGNGPGAHLTLWGYVNAVIMQGGDNQHGNSYSTVTAGDNNVEMQFNNRVTSNNHTIGVDNTGPYYKISGVRKNIGDPVMSYGTPQTGWSNANGIQGFRSTDGVIYLSISLISGTITTNTLVGTIGANLRPKYPIVVECYDFGYELLNNYKLVVLTNGDIRIRGTSTFITGRRYDGACAYVAS